MNTTGNILWIILGGGIFIFLEYFIAGILLCFTIIGIPFGLQAMRLGMLSLTPFGKEVTSSGRTEGCLSTLMNIIWVFAGGIWVALTHVLFAVIMAVTIIGIPFAKQHMKLASFSFTPFGREIRRR